MQFRNFVESLVGSKVKIKVLGHILSEGAVTSEREIARLIGVSPGAVNRTFKELHGLNLIAPMKVGNVTSWRLNEKSYAYEYLENFLRKLKNRDSPVSDLRGKIKELSYLPVIKRAVLFGSVAEGRELSESDIDLFVLVGNEKDRKDVFSLLGQFNDVCLQRYGNKLNLHAFTLEDMKNTKNRKFLENVMKGMVVIDR